MPEPVKVYADTSVFGGVFDAEFADASAAFFDQVRAGLFELWVSDVTEREIALAPPHVREFFNGLVSCMKTVIVDEHVQELRDAYVQAEVVSAKWRADAAHVAAATMAGADLIVSWNFKHLVHFDKIRSYNEV
ncbi:MAG: hypothetical protein WCK05_12150, partial [Planctomycetota bacterium]